MWSCKRHELHFQLCHTHSSLVQELLQHRCHQASGWHHTLNEVQILLGGHYYYIIVMQDYRHNNYDTCKVGSKGLNYRDVALTAHSINFSFARLALTALWCTSEASTAS